jgi:Putative peptidoglycan binding domain
VAYLFTVRQGDCIASIAEASGHFPDTIWKHPNNSELREKRTSANVLFPGDQVFVPDRVLRAETAAVDQKHVYVRKGVPQLFRLQLLKEGQPRAGLSYRIQIDGSLRSGATDGAGWLQQWIPLDAKNGLLILSPSESYPLKFGNLDPVSEESGVRARLVNLGYLATADASSSELAGALENFQSDNSLEVNGLADEATRSKLEAVHQI